MSDFLGGLTGAMLRVNLTSGEVIRSETPRDLFERFIGARGVGAMMLFQELPPHRGSSSHQVDILWEERAQIEVAKPLRQLLPLGSIETCTLLSLARYHHLCSVPRGRAVLELRTGTQEFLVPADQLPVNVGPMGLGGGEEAHRLQ